MTIESNETEVDVLDSVIKKGEEETKEQTVDQFGSALPEGFADQMDEALKEKSETTEVPEETTVEEEEVTIEETDVSEETTKVSDAEKEEKEETTEAGAEVTKKTSEEVEKPVVVEKPQVEEIKFDLDPELVDPQVKGAIDSIADTLNKQQKAIAEEREFLRLEREKVYENRIDKCFDSFATDLPDVGNSSSLTEQNGKYRRELFQHAHVTAQVHGVTIEEAIKDTVQMFKNRDGEKAAEKRLVTKLQKQKSKFTNPPTRKKTDVSKRKFANKTERANAIMTEAYKEAGID